MYVTVQKVKGKSKVYGYAKDVVTYTTSIGTTTKYHWHYSEDKFERENYSYKITVKESYRENGKVKQRQVVMGTYHWFDFIDHYVYEDELLDKKLSDTFADKTEEEINDVYDEIDKKVNEIEGIEYQKWSCSEEYKVHNRLLDMIQKYESRKKYYDDYLGEGYFEQIYDVHLKVMNKALYDKIPTLHSAKVKLDEEKREYEQRSYEESQKRWDNFYKNYTSGSYSAGSCSNYNNKEQEYLKKFYRALAAKFHPDVTGDNEIMQFLNKLKEQWGV